MTRPGVPTENECTHQFVCLGAKPGPCNLIRNRTPNQRTQVTIRDPHTNLARLLDSIAGVRYSYGLHLKDSARLTGCGAMPPKRPKIPSWNVLASHGVVAIVVAVFTFALTLQVTRDDTVYEFSFSTNPFGFNFSPSKDVSGLLEDLDRKLNSGSVDVVLETHGYYKLSSERLISKLRDINPNDEEWTELTSGLRRLLADLVGPFRLPGTLSEADESFMKALVALDPALSDHSSTEANAFFVELWKQFLKQQGIFHQRWFSAEVKMIKGSQNDAAVVYSCSGGALEDRQSISIFTQHGSVTAPVQIFPPHMACSQTERVSLRELFVQGVPLPLGLNQRAFCDLYQENLNDESSQCGEDDVQGVGSGGEVVGEARFFFQPEGTTTTVNYPEK